jgi:FAD/FMN-containing dehydrogenase
MTPSSALEADALDSLRGRFSGQLIVATDDLYDEARAIFNGMIDKFPALIARCSSTDDVASAIAFAREHDLPVAVRCGGHSTPGYSSCDDGLVIDVGGMKAVDIDPEARTARIGGGLTWGEFDAATQEHGLAVTGGRVSDTGVTGLTLGSGSGWLERLYGITCESLTGAEMVTADGEVVRAGPDGDNELLWGLRGGGGNFGVVTELTFDLHPVGPTLFGGMMLWPRSEAGRIGRAYRDFMASAPDEVGGGLALISAPPAPFIPEEMQLQPAVGVIYLYVGPVEDGEKAVAPIRALEPPVQMLAPLPYVGFQQLLDAGSPKGSHEYFRIDWLRELSDEALDAAIEHANTSPSPMTQVVFEPLGGAMDRMDRESMALSVPDAPWAYHCLGLWPNVMPDEPNVEWVRGFSEVMRPFAIGAAYPNFVAVDEDRERLISAYGPDKYARLVALKDRYDPGNLFRLNQNIKPSGREPRFASGA